MKKVELAEVIPSKKIIVGDPKASITWMMFGDYESEASAKANEVVKEILKAYPHEVKFIFRHFPLVRVNQKSHKAAEASLAAAQEGKFWEMHNELFAHQHSLGTISLKAHAREVGVKSKKILDDLLSSYFGVYVQDDLKEGIQLGVRDVPASFINGKRYEGDTTFKAINAYISNLLETENVKSKRATKAA